MPKKKSTTAKTVRLTSDTIVYGGGNRTTSSASASAGRQASSASRCRGTPTSRSDWDASSIFSDLSRLNDFLELEDSGLRSQTSHSSFQAETPSVGSSRSSALEQSTPRATLRDLWKDILIQLDSTKAGRRASILRDIWNLLVESGRCYGELLEGTHPQLINALQSSVAKATSEEAVLSCHLLGVVLLSLDVHSLDSTTTASLLAVLKRQHEHGSNGAVRSICAMTMGLLLYMGHDDDALREEEAEYFARRSEHFKARAADESNKNLMTLQAELEGFLLGYALLLSSPCFVSAVNRWDQWSPVTKLVELLSVCTVMGARTAFRSERSSVTKGGISAVLRCVLGYLLQNQYKQQTNLEAMLVARYQEMLEALQALGGRHQQSSAILSRVINKSMKKELLSNFRPVLATIDDGELDDRILRVSMSDRSSTVKFIHWLGILRYEVFRHFLKGSLHSHLIVGADLLALVTGRDIGQELAVVEEVQKSSGRQKAWQQDRDSQRSAKHEASHLYD